MIPHSLRPHRHVPHPLQQTARARHPVVAINARVLHWMSEHVLASVAMFDIALIVPLLSIPLSNNVKITLGVISGSWIQWWALPALQRSQVLSDKKHDRKADTDHRALTHIANTVDAIAELLQVPGHCSAIPGTSGSSGSQTKWVRF